MTGFGPTDPARKHRSPWLKKLLLAAAAVVMAGTSLWGYWRYTYPYGYSHSCSKSLGTSLRMYADDNFGWLPHGQATAEASLSTLMKSDDTVRNLLRGKHIQQKVVDQALRRDGVLGPESCGWHYVEGLREDDDPQTAVIWDKVTGLWHNGNRRSGSSIMHEIIRLDGAMEFISRERWPEFVAEQKKLLADTMAKRSKSDPPIRWSDEATLGPNVNPPSPVAPARRP